PRLRGRQPLRRDLAVQHRAPHLDRDLLAQVLDGEPRVVRLDLGAFDLPARAQSVEQRDRDREADRATAALIELVAEAEAARARVAAAVARGEAHGRPAAGGRRARALLRGTDAPLERPEVRAPLERGREQRVEV